MQTPFLRARAFGRELRRGWTPWSAVGVAVLFSLALAVPADAQWRDGGRRRPPSGYGSYNYNPGYSQGYDDGYNKGREDARDRDRYDVRRHSRYRSADRGYDRRDGSRGQYRQFYRQGFEAGYDEGYRQWSYNQRGWGWPGRGPRPR